MSELAPIVLFVYNRPEHTQATLEALAKNESAQESRLYIYCDGPKPSADNLQLDRINKVRVIAEQETRFKHVNVITREQNMGLASSIIAGVTEVLNTNEKIIVVEDDLVTSPHFLKYMNDSLNVYAHESAVACISGYTYPVKEKLPETFFIKGADCWGWATWKRAWELFEPDGKKLLKKIKENKLEKAFEFEGTYPYMKMLTDQIETKNDSWAIRWYASAFLENKLCLYPSLSLVSNIGVDGSGTHTGVTQRWNVNLSPIKIKVKPIKVEETSEAKKSFVNYFNSITGTGNSYFTKLLRKVKWLIKK